MCTKHKALIKKNVISFQLVYFILCFALLCNILLSMNTCHSQIDRWPFSASDRASQLTVTWKNSCREFELFNVIQNCITFKRLFTATCLEINWDKTCREYRACIYLYFISDHLFSSLYKNIVFAAKHKMYFRIRGVSTSCDAKMSPSTLFLAVVDSKEALL